MGTINDGSLCGVWGRLLAVRISVVFGTIRRGQGKGCSCRSQESESPPDPFFHPLGAGSDRPTPFRSRGLTRHPGRPWPGPAAQCVREGLWQPQAGEGRLRGPEPPEIGRSAPCASLPVPGPEEARRPDVMFALSSVHGRTEEWWSPLSILPSSSTSAEADEASSLKAKDGCHRPGNAEPAD